MADNTAELMIKVVSPDGTQRTFRDVKQGFDDTTKGAEDAGEGVDEATSSLRRLVQLGMAQQLRQLSDGFKQLARGVSEAVSAVDKHALAAADQNRTFLEYARTLHITANEMEALTIAFERGGLQGDPAKVGELFRYVSQGAERAIQGSKEMQERFQRLGVTAEEAMSKPAEATIALVDAMTQGESEAQAMADAQELLGRQGAKLIVNLRGQGRSLSEVRDGLLATVSLTDEQREAYQDLKDSAERLEDVERRIARTLDGATTPALIELKTRLAGVLEEITDTNPEFATFLGLAQQTSRPVLDAAGGLLQMGIAIKLMGGNLRTVLPLLGKGAGLVGLVGLLATVMTVTVRKFDDWGTAAEKSSSRVIRALGSVLDWIVNNQRKFSPLGWLGLFGREDNSLPAPTGVGGRSRGGGAGRDFEIPDLPPPSTTGGSVGSAGAGAQTSTERANAQGDELQKVRASLLSQIRRAEAQAETARITADEALASEAAARLKSAQEQLAQVEGQLIALGNQEIRTQILNDQADRQLREAQARQQELAQYAVNGSVSIGEASARADAEAARKAREALLEQAAAVSELARAQLDLVNISGTPEQQAAAMDKVSDALTRQASAYASVGDNVRALQSLAERDRLNQAQAGKLTIGQEILAAGGTSGIQDVLRKSGRLGGFADMTGVLSPPGVSGMGMSPSDIGKQAGSSAAPALAEAVNAAMSATVERVAAVTRAGVQ